jgi:hypothetical protein
VHRATAVLLAAVSLALTACGGTKEMSDRDQVAATVQAFGRATAARDYPRLCGEILAQELVTRIQQAGLTCRDALRTGLQGVRDPQVTVGTVAVDGDRATADVRTTATGQPPSVDRVRLVREGGRWRIASLAAP